MGEITARPSGSRHRGEMPLLEQPAPPPRPPRTIILPILNNRSRFAPSHKSRREHRVQVHKMAVSQAGSRKKHRLPSVQKRRDRVSKPSKKDRPQASQTDLWQTMIGPDTRVGISKYAPIIIDDDDDDGAEDSPRRNNFFDNSRDPSTLVSQRRSIYTPSPTTPRSHVRSPIKRLYPGQMRGPWTSMSSPASEHGRYREARIYLDTARRGTAVARPVPRSTIAEAVNSSSRSCPWPSNEVHAQTTPSVTAKPAPKTQSRHATRNHQAFTLYDVLDAGMRRKVAKLMRVAPALPVQDLLDLLVEAEGALPVARREAVLASQPPPALPRVKSELGETAGPSRKTRLIGYDHDGDEVMIKIDPKADFLEYDTDSPPPEDAPSKYEASKRGGKTKSSAMIKKQSLKLRPGVAVKKPARKARENSIGREFIDADNVVHLDTDFGSSGPNSSSLGSSSDTDMDDAAEDVVEDLTIDVQPRYAYNSNILKRARK